MAQDPSETGELTRSLFSYAGFGPIQKNEVWGCELDAFLTRKYGRTRKLGSIAVRRHVTCADVRRFGEFASHCGVEVAPLQAQGEYLNAA